MTTSLETKESFVQLLTIYKIIPLMLLAFFFFLTVLGCLYGCISN